MNIKISKEEHDYLNQHLVDSFVIGSRLYGTAREDSDEDILCIYDNTHIMSICPQLCTYLPNYHQFQYDDKENNRQYIWTSHEQFYKNLYSGDSTINTDVVIFHKMVFDPLKFCRTYKIIRAYIGFANRDLKDLKRNENKLFHAHRGLYCAEALLHNSLPTVGGVKFVSENLSSAGRLIEFSEALRKICNGMFESGSLEMYYVPALPKSLLPYNTLMNKLIRSNNTKEFKYE